MVECLAEEHTAAVTSEAIQAHSGFSEYFQGPSESQEIGIERFKEAVLEVATRLESAFERAAKSLPGPDDLSGYYHIGTESDFWDKLLTARDKRRRQDREEGEAQDRPEQAATSSVSVPGDGRGGAEQNAEPDLEFWEDADEEAAKRYRQSMLNVGEPPRAG